MSMSFKYYTGGSGEGKLGALNVTQKNLVVNGYAQVTAVSGKTATLGNIGDADKFKVGVWVMLHISAYKGTTYDRLGRWFISQVTAVDGTTLTFKRSISDMAAALSKGAYVQAVTIPEYTKVTINANASITCPQFDQTKGYGGIVAFKCSQELVLNGGHIDLNGKGLPSADLRPLFNFESDEKLTGYENYKRKGFLALNYPDGAAMLMLQKLTWNEISRIGNPDASGKARTLESSQGGASIYIAVRETGEDGNNLTPATISKAASKSGGKGRPGCYIATEGYLPCDEGLYAYDRIAITNRMTDTFKIKDFGDGSFGAKTNYTNRLNSYAQITGIDKTRKVLTIGQRDNGGLAKIANGALVMLHATYNGGYYKFSGFFTVARILDYTLNKITIDRPFTTPNNSSNLTPEYYGLQLVTIPQFTDFTLSGTNEKMLAYDRDKGFGGIVALACNGTCDLKGGKILTVGKGGARATGEYGLNYESNARMAESLPIGEGNGSVFILTKTLDIDKNTRLGGSWSGEGFGGSWNGGQASYGYAPADDNEQFGSGRRGGVGKRESSHFSNYNLNGGYNSNGSYSTNSTTANSLGGYQGAHILIIADKITNMNLAAISTGGQGNQQLSPAYTYHKNGVVTGYYFAAQKGGNGGAGYGGGSGSYSSPSLGETQRGGSGGWLGGGGGYCFAALLEEYNRTGYNPGGVYEDKYIGGGGSGGFCFVYCNSFDSEDKSWLAYD